MSIREVFKAFSLRTQAPAQPVQKLTPEFRARVMMLCRDAHPHSEFWDEIHQKMTYRLGRPRLVNSVARSRAEDVLYFLESCDDKYFLDFIEYIFTTNAQFHVGANSFVDGINQFLEQDHLPYVLTKEVWRDVTGEGFARSVLVSRPQVFRKDSELVHNTATEPALQLLRRPEFASANDEFMQAQQHYKRGEYGDCLTKCGSAFESVLKIVCKAKGWQYSESDVAAPLIKKVIGNTGIEGFFEKPLLQVAIMRNELSTAHGAGGRPRTVSMAKAQYALNSTAAAALFLVAEAGL